MISVNKPLNITKRHTLNLDSADKIEEIEYSDTNDLKKSNQEVRNFRMFRVLTNQN